MNLSFSGQTNVSARFPFLVVITHRAARFNSAFLAVNHTNSTFKICVFVVFAIGWIYYHFLLLSFLGV